MTTIHIEAKKDQIAKIVLVCGDPLRAKYFTENFLFDFKLVNSIRGMLAFTGYLKNTKIKVTVMGHGMGFDSIGIYVHELYEYYDVDLIIRFGSAGSYDTNIELGTVLIAKSSWTESNFGLAYGYEKDTVNVTPKIYKIAKHVSEKDKNILHSKINSSMWFYRTNNIKSPAWYTKKGILAVEMESYALYIIAHKFQKEAITVLTIADNLVNKNFLTAAKREIGFTKMFNFVINLVKEYENHK